MRTSTSGCSKKEAGRDDRDNSDDPAAERLALQIVEEAKSKATDEAAKIVAQAQAEAQQESAKARDALRDQVAALAVKGAEQILRREVSPAVHAELLNRLQTEL